MNPDDSFADPRSTAGKGRSPRPRHGPVLIRLVVLAAGLLVGCSSGAPSLPPAPAASATPAAAAILPPAASPATAPTLPPTAAAPTLPPATAAPAAPSPTLAVPGGTPTPALDTGRLPVPDHIVIVMEENHGYPQVIGAAAAPYMNALAAQGALFTDSHGVTHPSQANYLALFSGSPQGVTGDACPQHLAAPNLGSALPAAGRSFVGYAEDLPAPGSPVCNAGEYARKHSPWVNFANVPATANRPFDSFPGDYGTLPTVAFVVPNLLNDMHDGSVGRADTWLQQHLDGYVRWAAGHNSLLILQWDEDEGTGDNRIPTIFVGPMVRPGTYGEYLDHYRLLRTVEEMYGLPSLGQSAAAQPLTDVWQGAGGP